MIVLLALPVIAAVALAHRYLLLYAPSNVLVRRVRASRPTLASVSRLLALTALLLVAMKVTSDAVESGAPGWLNLVVLVLAWDAIKVGGLAVLQLCAAVAARAKSGIRTRTKVRRRAVRDDESAALRLCA